MNDSSATEKDMECSLREVLPSETQCKKLRRQASFRTDGSLTKQKSGFHSEIIYKFGSGLFFQRNKINVLHGGISFKFKPIICGIYNFLHFK